MTSSRTAATTPNPAKLSAMDPLEHRRPPARQTLSCRSIACLSAVRLTLSAVRLMPTGFDGTMSELSCGSNLLTQPACRIACAIASPSSTRVGRLSLHSSTAVVTSLAGASAITRADRSFPAKRGTQEKTGLSMQSKWRKRSFDAPWVTEHPPGPNLSRLNNQKVYVTSPGFDNIGEILTSMNVQYEPFNGKFDCSILFINCGTSDLIPSADLIEFVRSGGCVYASDHADTFIQAAFPTLFDFAGHTGASGQIRTEVLDPELRELLGQYMTIEFDMGSWAQLRSCEGEILLRTVAGNSATGMPIMAYTEFGKGSIFYTCFHNKSQTNDDEKRLLQLLVVKQFSTVSSRTLRDAGESMGLNLA